MAGHVRHAAHVDASRRQAGAWLVAPHESLLEHGSAGDATRAGYAGAAPPACWQALVQIKRVLDVFRGRFVGKTSPVHFWWGSFDLAHTRFSGRPAPVHPGGIPNLSDAVTREAYSRECISVGWW